MNRNYTITVCGASRVGKSTLINAIVGREVAKTSSSLNSCTKTTVQYVLERNMTANDQRSNYTITFWDTPGVESWTQDNVRSYFATLMRDTNPVCMIYCASPVSFADTKQVQWFVENCFERNIFVALICTNMFAGNRCSDVMKQFVDLLENINPSIERRRNSNIEYFGQKALCTMVNSKQYIDEDWNVQKDVSGIEELIFGIAQCLNGEQQLFWFQAVSENNKFWSLMGGHVNDILHVSMDTLSHISNQACAITTYLLSMITRTDPVREKELSSSLLSSDTSKKTTTKKKKDIHAVKHSSSSKRDKIVSFLRFRGKQPIESVNN